MQEGVIHALLVVHLHVGRRLQGPVPAVVRVDVVGADDLGFADLVFCHVTRAPIGPLVWNEPDYCIGLDGADAAAAAWARRAASSWKLAVQSRATAKAPSTASP